MRCVNVVGRRTAYLSGGVGKLYPIHWILDWPKTLQDNLTIAAQEEMRFRYYLSRMLLMANKAQFKRA